MARRRSSFSTGNPCGEPRGFEKLDLAAFLFIAFHFDCPLETEELISPTLEPITGRQAFRGSGGDHKAMRNCRFCAELRTIRGDNQRNTCRELRLLCTDRSAVISKWDESARVSKSIVGYEIRGGHKMATMTAEQVGQKSLVRSQSVVARVVAGETLIVPIRAKVGDLASIYSFNGTASSIWKWLESPRTVAELAMAVAEEYGVDLAQAERDVTEFVEEMKAVGLVEAPASVAMAGD